MSAGRFLAADWGARFQAAKYYCSGFKVFVWYTYTSARDVVNGSIYHDKGIGFSMPLEIFFTQRSRRRWGYGMSAWLRDVGARSATGYDLYSLIHSEREE